MPGGSDLRNEVINTSLCTMCGTCLDWCPYIKNLEDRIAIPFDCGVNDGRCYVSCPRTYTDWGGVVDSFIPDKGCSGGAGRYVQVYKARSTVPYKNQQDGGTVSSLLLSALEDMAFESAILTGSADDDPLVPLPIIGGFEDIGRSTGSRFLSSPGMRCLNSALKAGHKSLIVVGRPCQIQGLRKWQLAAGDSLNDANIIAIGLFCMWSLSWSFKTYLQESYPGDRFTAMTIPRHGVQVLSSMGSRVIDTDTVRGYAAPGCQYCLDMCSELADLSVGACEADPGWNTVLVRTAAGSSLLDMARERGRIELEIFPESELARLENASLAKKARGLANLRKDALNGAVKPFVDLENSELQAMENSHGKGRE